MNTMQNNGYCTTTTRWAVWLVCVMVMAWPVSSPQAALLDGLMDGVEESLAEKLAKKGESLQTGNFYTPESPNAHGPIGMMGEHTHNEGEMMFTYRYMHMSMEENRNGTSRLSNAAARALGPQTPMGYMVVPTDMRMDMHMFSGMYGVNNTLTLMVMVPYIQNSMNHVAGMPLGKVTFQTNSEGFGDLKLGSLWRLWAVEAPSLGAHRFHVNFNVSLPTGSYTVRDTTPTGNIRLPYPMQLGSGTVDVYPGLTYNGEKGLSSWGLQALGTVRIGRNSEGYSKGEAYQVNAYGAHGWTPWVSNSVRFHWQDWGNYDGRDFSMPSPAMVPTADPTRRGGQRLDVLAGINFLFPEVSGWEHRLGVEGGIPVYQKLNGPQLETDWLITFGWQVIH